MATDTRALQRDVERWAERVQTAAVDSVLAELDRRVPRGSGPARGRRLAQTRRVRDRSGGRRLSTTIEYQAPQAAFTDEGTRPHRIQGNPLLVFYWPRAGRTVFLRHANHPGSTKHKGWFSDATDAGHWDRALRLGLSRNAGAL